MNRAIKIFMSESVPGVRVTGDRSDAAGRVLTQDALAFVADLHRRFDGERRRLLSLRRAREKELHEGRMPEFLEEKRTIRDSDWRVAPAPDDLQDRRVEITGPVDRKMMINALNSGARVFMADFEDALAPTWANVVEGQANCMDAVRGTIRYDDPEKGKSYELAERTATLVVRPRGWHLHEKHVTVDGEPISASLFDFGLCFYHNAAAALERGSGPYFYLPKLENHLEARLWNDVFVHAQDALGIPHGSVRATVLIETILAAFEMEEILYELRDHASGLNAGRWDYIFSIIKKFRNRPDFVLPDRSQVTMGVPFMRSYSQLLVRTCHRRGAHAIGGMAAFIPNRRNPDVTERALAKVREDKDREAGDGFDGSWVAHPDLVPIAAEVFDRVLGDRPHQKERLREDVQPRAGDLLEMKIPGGEITRNGVHTNVSVGLRYIESWLRGVGAAAIDDLMEDAATAEISRAQLWQWLHRGARLADGTSLDRGSYLAVREQETLAIEKAGGDGSRVREAADLLDRLVLSEEFEEFLTLPAYERL